MNRAIGLIYTDIAVSMTVTARASSHTIDNTQSDGQRHWKYTLEQAHFMQLAPTTSRQINLDAINAFPLYKTSVNFCLKGSLR